MRLRILLLPWCPRHAGKTLAYTARNIAQDLRRVWSGKWSKGRHHFQSARIKFSSAIALVVLHILCSTVQATSEQSADTVQHSTHTMAWSVDQQMDRPRQ